MTDYGRVQSVNVLLTPAEVAKMFRVDPKTVTRWANQGKIPSIRTPGGQRRFPRDEINAMLEKTRTEVTQKEK